MTESLCKEEIPAEDVPKLFTGKDGAFGIITKVEPHAEDPSLTQLEVAGNGASFTIVTASKRKFDIGNKLCFRGNGEAIITRKYNTESTVNRSMTNAELPSALRSFY